MVDQQRISDEDAARRYDTPGEDMFAPDLLGPTVAVLVELADGGSALEFAIGTGRVAIPLSQAGVDVTGIELSTAMHARLREKVGPEQLPVVVGDMATASAGSGFALVYLVFNTISNLLSQHEQIQCFRNAARHLRPGGRFVVELWVPQLQAVAPGHAGVLEASEPGTLRVDTYDTLHQVTISYHVSFDADITGSRDARIWRSPHRYIWPSELDLMAALAGFELESRWADWDRSAFTASSRSHVSTYRLATLRNVLDQR